MNLFKNSNKHFWLKQIGLAFVFLGVFVFLLLLFLDVWTRHGKQIAVPNLQGKTLDEVQKILDENSLRFEVLDSAVFNPKKPIFSVIEQAPAPGEMVKQNRKIYLTINPSNYQKVSVPKIIQITRRNAEAILKAIGLQVGNVTYVDNIGKDMVLKITHKGKIINPGDLLLKTSVIDLECGNGFDPTLLEMPIDSIPVQEEFNSPDDILK